MPRPTLLAALLVVALLAAPSAAFTARFSASSSICNSRPVRRTIVARRSTWDDFAFDDDDALLDAGVDSEFVAADENDDPRVKAAAGMALEAPEVEWDGPAIDVPQGSQLELDEETVQGVLAACREEIGTMFGYSLENRGVGITGGVDFVELDGPTVVLHLKGRFWHQRPTVLQRVGAYLMARIPEIVDVVVADEYELTDEANDLAI
ncbi:hypothetical protein ACHAXT_007841 [Thalassiosira profunda]